MNILIVLIVSLLAVFSIASVSVSPLNKKFSTDVVNSFSLETDTLSNPQLSLDVILAKKTLNISIDQYKTPLCKQLNVRFPYISDNTELLTYSHIAQELSCNVQVSSKVKDILDVSFSAESVEDAYVGGMSVLFLSNTPRSPIDVSRYDILDLVHMFRDLLLPDGSTRNSVKMIASNFGSTGKAAEILAMALTSDHTQSIRSSLLPLSSIFLDALQKSIVRMCEDPSLSMAEPILSGLFSLSHAISSSPSSLNVDLTCLVPLLSHQTTSTNVAVVARAVHLASMLVSPNYPSPTFLSLSPSPSYSHVQIGILSDAMGNPVSEDHYSLSATVNNASVSISKGRITFPSLSVPTTVTVTATPRLKKGELKKTTSSLFLHPSPKSSSLEKVTLTVSDSKKAKGGSVLNKPFKRKLTLSANAAVERYLVADVELADSTFHSVSIVFTDESGIVSLAVPISPIKRNSKLYSAAIDLTSSSTTYALQDGTYTLSIVYAPIGGKSSTEVIGSVKLSEIAHISQHVPLKDIQHTFKPEIQHPSSIVSIIFTLLMFIPLVYILFISKDQLTRVVFTSVEGFVALNFVVVFASTIGIIVLYWYCMSLLTALPIVLIACIVLCFTGHAALRKSIERRGLHFAIDENEVSKKVD